MRKKRWLGLGEMRVGEERALMWDDRGWACDFLAGVRRAVTMTKRAENGWDYSMTVTHGVPRCNALKPCQVDSDAMPDALAHCITQGRCAVTATRVIVRRVA